MKLELWVYDDDGSVSTLRCPNVEDLKTNAKPVLQVKHPERQVGILVFPEEVTASEYGFTITFTAKAEGVGTIYEMKREEPNV